MNKKHIVFFTVILVVSCTVFFFLGKFLSVASDANVLVSAAEFSNLKDAAKEDSKFKEIISLIKNNYLYKVTDETLYEGKLKGVVAALGDPYSEYFTKEEYKAFMEETNGKFGGIGIVVSPGENGYITVVSPIADTPAERAGIRAGDFIVGVDGEKYSAEQMNQEVKKMRGEPNTKVKIKILRESKFMDLELKREIIHVDSVKTAMIPKSEIGVLKITSFSDDTYAEFSSGLSELKNKGAKGVILDLRGNPGGLLDVVEEIADDLLGKVNIIYVQNKAGEKVYRNSDSRMDNIPITVLIDKGSASASEILAGTLKDNKRAKLVGERSFGKGIVQRLHSFPDGSGLKLTESEYHLPNGESIHKKGIEPDYKVELPKDIKGIGVEHLKEDLQLQKAVEVLTKEIKK